MNRMRCVCVTMMLTLIVLTISGCVELTGQRLSWRYDAQADRIDALLFYDGIHDKDNEPEKCAADLTQFVNDGEIMLGDWFGHLWQPGDIKPQLDNPDANLSPAERQLMRQAIASIHTHAIGHYRDGAGHIGAAQAITITDARKLAAAINEQINESLVSKTVEDSYEYKRTQRLMCEAAKKNHAWFKIEGNAIVYTMPVDRGDWAKMKAEFFAGGMNNLADDNGADTPADEMAQLQRSIGYMTQVLSSCPVSYTEQSGMVTIRLGDPAAANTLRYRVHERYNEKLAALVQQQVPTNLDAELAKYLRDDKHTPNADLDAIIAFGPAEQQITALVNAAHHDDATGENALAKLKNWAKQWNADHSYPQAPPEATNPEATDQKAPDPKAAYLQSWDTWLRQMASYPVDPPEVPTAPQGPDAPATPAE